MHIMFSVISTIIVTNILIALVGSGYDEFDSNQGNSDKGKSISDHSIRQVKK